MSGETVSRENNQELTSCEDDVDEDSEVTRETESRVDIRNSRPVKKKKKKPQGAQQGGGIMK